MVCFSIYHLQNKAFGSDIRDKVANITETSPTLAQVYGTLCRLERKCLVFSEETNIRPPKGGKFRRVFSLTKLGKLALDKSLTLHQHTTNVLASMPKPNSESTSIETTGLEIGE